MRAREYIEHQYIPWILFLDKRDTIKHFVDGKESYLCELYNHISKEFKALERYELFMFRVEFLKQATPLGLVHIIAVKTPEAILQGESAYLFIVYNDNELIYMCYENNEEAENIIIDKYKNCIVSILKGYLKEYNITKSAQHPTNEGENVR